MKRNQQNLKYGNCYPGQMAPLVGVSSLIPNVCGFSLRSGHIRRLWVPSLVGAHTGGNQLISLSLSIPFFKINKKHSLLSWLVWLRGLTAGMRTKGSPVQLSVRAHTWIAGGAPGSGPARGNQSLSLKHQYFEN